MTLDLTSEGKLRLPRCRRKASKSTEVGRKALRICYGSNEPRPRQDIGREIDAILSGILKIDGPVLKPSNSPIHQTTGQSNTHPFFQLSNRRVAEEKQKAEKSESGSPAGRKVDAKNTIACTTPSRIRGILNSTTDKIELKSLPADGAPAKKRSNAIALPGSREPLWPSQDMQLVLPSPLSDLRPSRTYNGTHGIPRRKLKGRKFDVGLQESILHSTETLVSRLREGFLRSSSRISKRVELPCRRTFSGKELQVELLCRLSTSPSLAMGRPGSADDSSLSHCPRVDGLHPAVADLLHALPSSRSAFDEFQCETQQWICKFAPKKASHVLQDSIGVMKLRDWLKQSAVMENGKQIVHHRKIDGVRRQRRTKRKRKELDDFIVTSDEDTSEPDEPMIAQDVVSRNLQGAVTNVSSKNLTMLNVVRDAHAVVLSGPHGCGKTATVYAAAKELDFEVFEINPGSRRSGKDILEKIGEMTRNHLIHRKEEQRGPSPCRSMASTGPTHEMPIVAVDSQPKSILQSFQSRHETSKCARDLNATVIRHSNDQGSESKPRGRSSKASLILIEEGDIIFEEDKQFWATVIDLSVQSKRPIIITCTNEGALPLDDLAIAAVLRLVPASTAVATDYLLLVAAVEGHLLQRKAIEKLYEEKARDLRASLMELNFHCQMAIGDEKCGLDWRLLEPLDEDTRSVSGHTLRAISEGSYRPELNQIPRDFFMEIPGASSQGFFSQYTVSGTWEENAMDLLEHLSEQALVNRPETSPDDRMAKLETLETLDHRLDALSIADAFCPLGVKIDGRKKMDPSITSPTESIALHYTEEAPVLLTESMIDVKELSTALAVTLASAAILGSAQQSKVVDSGGIVPSHKVSSEKHNLISIPNANGQVLRTSLTPLSIPSKASLRPSGYSEIDHSSVDTLAEDVAPYIRAILRYDMQLAEQRRQLELALFPGAGEDGPVRRTRASRAALEGGDKSSTRREKWFDVDLDSKMILDTDHSDPLGVVCYCQSNTDEVSSVVHNSGEASDKADRVEEVPKNSTPSMSL